MADGTKLRCARICVIVFGIISYVLAINSEGVYELIETAAAFASAGVLVAGTFGLFTQFGGAASAIAALVTGTLVWCAGEWAELVEAPYLASLASAALAYVGFALYETERVPAL
jgi:Na+/proline symporter